uniref:Uncharacterized protein n=1 Tax=Chromera velia CCMP2878 TaxID=1169474 RepID=A0A0G4GKW2_9ALVE|eukprot:Cvel_22362.t1-p1 / transcript=Cvel_22362.t1 / gene=Cvel_22362 / organism=Chromera_velia_CCMP2878 / gene_product=hypothetical protein / transcript_product=hypothetical protein / location=Cvel_scaffold2190:19347-32691(+) / protein_length=2231 / sequence_SO=supercontig / SO=protein_coding / is_pseudo=false
MPYPRHIFGLEKACEYTKHLSSVQQLLQIGDDKFATADETSIRVWDSDGEIRRLTHTRQRRNVVCALTYVDKYHVFLSCEVDLTFKVFGERLQILDTIHNKKKYTSVGNFRSRHSDSRKPDYFIIAGGKEGLDVWLFSRSNVQRPDAGKSLHPFIFTIKQMEWPEDGGTAAIIKGLKTNVEGIRVFPTEHRFAVWTGAPEFGLYIFNLDLQLQIFQRGLHKKPITCVDIRVMSEQSQELCVLTGSADQTVSLWRSKLPQKRHRPASFLAKLTAPANTQNPQANGVAGAATPAAIEEREKADAANKHHQEQRRLLTPPSQADSATDGGTPKAIAGPHNARMRESVSPPGSPNLHSLTFGPNVTDSANLPASAASGTVPEDRERDREGICSPKGSPLNPPHAAGAETSRNIVTPTDPGAPPGKRQTTTLSSSAKPRGVLSPRGPNANGKVGGSQGLKRKDANEKRGVFSWDTSLGNSEKEKERGGEATGDLDEPTHAEQTAGGGGGAAGGVQEHTAESGSETTEVGRLWIDHTFTGHTRPVCYVCFFWLRKSDLKNPDDETNPLVQAAGGRGRGQEGAKEEEEVPQVKFLLSAALDGSFCVWSLGALACLLALPLPLASARGDGPGGEEGGGVVGGGGLMRTCWPLRGHSFAVETKWADGMEQRLHVQIHKFSSQLCEPLAFLGDSEATLLGANPDFRHGRLSLRLHTLRPSLWCLAQQREAEASLQKAREALYVEMGARARARREREGTMLSDKGEEGEGGPGAEAAKEAARREMESQLDRLLPDEFLSGGDDSGEGGKAGLRLCSLAEGYGGPGYADRLTAVATADSSLRLLSSREGGVVLVLPPPAAVSVKAVSVCGELNLITVLLCSDEVALFFVPDLDYHKKKLAERMKAGQARKEGEGGGSAENGGDTGAASSEKKTQQNSGGPSDISASLQVTLSPILLRRFSSFDIRPRWKDGALRFLTTDSIRSLSVMKKGCRAYDYKQPLGESEERAEQTERTPPRSPQPSPLPVGDESTGPQQADEDKRSAGQISKPGTREGRRPPGLVAANGDNSRLPSRESASSFSKFSRLSKPSQTTASTVDSILGVRPRGLEDDWTLWIGTNSGTLIAILLRDILADSRAWQEVVRTYGDGDLIHPSVRSVVPDVLDRTLSPDAPPAPPTGPRNSNHRTIRGSKGPSGGSGGESVVVHGSLRGSVQSPKRSLKKNRGTKGGKGKKGKHRRGRPQVSSAEEAVPIKITPPEGVPNSRNSNSQTNRGGADSSADESHYGLNLGTSIEEFDRFVEENARKGRPVNQRPFPPTHDPKGGTFPLPIRGRMRVSESAIESIDWIFSALVCKTGEPSLLFLDAFTMEPLKVLRFRTPEVRSPSQPQAITCSFFCPRAVPKRSGYDEITRQEEEDRIRAQQEEEEAAGTSNIAPVLTPRDGQGVLSGSTFFATGAFGQWPSRSPTSIQQEKPPMQGEPNGEDPKKDARDTATSRASSPRAASKFSKRRQKEMEEKEKERKQKEKEAEEAQQREREKKRALAEEAERAKAGVGGKGKRLFDSEDEEARLLLKSVMFGLANGQVCEVEFAPPRKGERELRQTIDDESAFIDGFVEKGADLGAFQKVTEMIQNRIDGGSAGQYTGVGGQEAADTVWLRCCRLRERVGDTSEEPGDLYIGMATHLSLVRQDQWLPSTDLERLGWNPRQPARAPKQQAVAGAAGKEGEAAGTMPAWGGRRSPSLLYPHLYGDDPLSSVLQGSDETSGGGGGNPKSPPQGGSAEKGGQQRLTVGSVGKLRASTLPSSGHQANLSRVASRAGGGSRKSVRGVSLVVPRRPAEVLEDLQTARQTGTGRNFMDSRFRPSRCLDKKAVETLVAEGEKNKRPASSKSESYLAETFGYALPRSARDGTERGVVTDSEDAGSPRPYSAVSRNAFSRTSRFGVSLGVIDIVHRCFNEGDLAAVDRAHMTLHKSSERSKKHIRRLQVRAARARYRRLLMQERDLRAQRKAEDSSYLYLRGGRERREYLLDVQDAVPSLRPKAQAPKRLLDSPRRNLHLSSKTPESAVARRLSASLSPQKRPLQGESQLKGRKRRGKGKGGGGSASEGGGTSPGSGEEKDRELGSEKADASSRSLLKGGKDKDNQREGPQTSSGSLAKTVSQSQSISASGFLTASRSYQSGGGDAGSPLGQKGGGSLRKVPCEVDGFLQPTLLTRRGDFVCLTNGFTDWLQKAVDSGLLDEAPRAVSGWVVE